MRKRSDHPATRPVRLAGTAAQVLESAARAVAKVLGEGQSADAALAALPQSAQRGAVQAVTLGTLRWYLRLAPAVLPLLARPGAQIDVQLRALLACAVHQLEYSPHPPATTVAAAVDAARSLDLGHAAGLVNAVLRRYLREREATLLQADLTAPPTWWDGMAFDAILLDAPCSGTGVIRRHPDIKLLRRASDIDGFASRQLALLRGCWSLLKPGGRLLYATCSVLPAENAAVIRAFQAEAPGAVVAPIPEPLAVLPLHECSPGWQRLPGAAGDGFYYACLHKEGEGA